MLDPSILSSTGTSLQTSRLKISELPAHLRIAVPWLWCRVSAHTAVSLATSKVRSVRGVMRDVGSRPSNYFVMSQAQQPSFSSFHQDAWALGCTLYEFYYSTCLLPPDTFKGKDRLNDQLNFIRLLLGQHSDDLKPGNDVPSCCRRKFKVGRKRFQFTFISLTVM